MNPKVLKINVPSDEQIIEILQSAGIDPDINIGSIPYAVTDEQEKNVADALINLMMEGLSEDDKCKMLEQLKRAGRPRDWRTQQIEEIKQKMGYRID